MRLLQTIGLTAALTFGTLQASAQEFEKNIMTGGASGTYIQFGRDIADLGNACGQTLNVQESAGSLENIIAVRDRRNTQFGIVQSDLLQYFKTFSPDDAALQRIIQNVVIAAPLYNEEIQILARKDIATLDDLNGQRVSIGVEDSGTFLTATLVLGLTGTDPVARLNLNAGASLEALIAGQIDAFFYVAGAPTSLLAEADISGDDFHLLPLTQPELAAEYVTTSIPAGTYQFQPDAVDVMAVKAVLMTYDYDRNRNRYHAQSCDAVSEFTHQIVKNFGELQSSGHPKWKNVNLADVPPGWLIGACVNRGLNPDYRSSCTAPEPVANTAPVETNNGANDLYRERICAVVGGCN